MSLWGSLSNLPTFFSQFFLSNVQSGPKSKSMTRSVLQQMTINSELDHKRGCTAIAFCKFVFSFSWEIVIPWPIWVGEYPAQHHSSLSQPLVISLFSLISEGLCAFLRSFLWLKEQQFKDASDQQLQGKEQKSDWLQGYQLSMNHHNQPSITVEDWFLLYNYNKREASYKVVHSYGWLEC